jgi:hypothetical protein
MAKIKKGQRFSKHTNKTKDRVTRTPLKTCGDIRCSGRVNISSSTSGTRHVNLGAIRPGSVYVKCNCNISVVICDTEIP